MKPRVTTFRSDDPTNSHDYATCTRPRTKDDQAINSSTLQKIFAYPRTREIYPLAGGRDLGGRCLDGRGHSANKPTVPPYATDDGRIIASSVYDASWAPEGCDPTDESATHSHDGIKGGTTSLLPYINLANSTGFNPTKMVASDHRDAMHCNGAVVAADNTLRSIGVRGTCVMSSKNI